MSHTPDKKLISLLNANLSSNFSSTANTLEQVVGNCKITLPIIAKVCTVKITIQFYSTFGAGNNNVSGTIGPTSTGLGGSIYSNVYAGGAQSNAIYSNVGIATIDLSTQQYAAMTITNDASTVISFSANAFRTALIVEIYG
ncbi:MAG: hypothetical protein NVS1B10_01590 [Candidatus Saccharimonadales bacterium]